MSPEPETKKLWYWRDSPTDLILSPLKGRFKGAATNSAKGVFYGRGHNGFKTKFKPLEECIRIATGE